MNDWLKRYGEELQYFLSSKLYVICTLFIAVLSYGFAATNVTLSIDDLNGDNYVGSGNVMLKAGRWGMVLINRIFGLTPDMPCNSFAIDVLSVFFFIWAAINLCILSRRISLGKMDISMSTYTVFTCFLISYPLINEIWEYTGANLCCCFGYFLVSVALLLIWEQLHREGKYDWKAFALAIACMTIVCSAYEAVVLVYIFTVFALLGWQIVCGGDNSFKFSFKQGLVYAGVLLAAIVMRVVIHQIILIVFSLQYAPNGNTGFYWATRKSIGEGIIKTFGGLLFFYILNALVYFPIAEFLVVFFLSVFVLAKAYMCCRSKVIIWLYLFAIPSMFILGIVQGIPQGYRVSSGVLSVFVAVNLAILWQCFASNMRCECKYFQFISSVVIVGLCVWQASFLNRTFMLNHIRHAEEDWIVRTIVHDINVEKSDKSYVVVGSIGLNNMTHKYKYVDEKSWQYAAIRRLYDKFKISHMIKDGIDIYGSDLNSFVNWSFNSGPNISRRILQYYGFTGKIADYSKFYAPAKDYVLSNNVPCYPQKGYIADAGEYMVVNLGVRE